MTETTRLDKYGYIVCFGFIIGPVIMAAIFFACAGGMDLPRAWIYFIMIQVYYIIGTILIAVTNPALMNVRGARRSKVDSKSWDKILVPVYGIFAFYLQPALMGLDVGRYNWSGLSGSWMIAGIVIFTMGFIINYWAMYVNTHFETNVRIQSDRDHKVIQDGPYRLARHPGYTGIILTHMAAPLILGSFYGLFAGVLAAITLIIRTSMEDRTLQLELDGYLAYKQKTKYRLIPGIW